MFVIPDFRQSPKFLDAQGKKQKIKQVKGFDLNLLLVEMAVIETADVCCISRIGGMLCPSLCPLSVQYFGQTNSTLR